MLVLTRKPNEQIQIGDQITVSILRIKGNTVRVGIQAPREVRVVRGELPVRDRQAAAPGNELLEGERAEGSLGGADDLGADDSDLRVELKVGLEALELLAHLASPGDATDALWSQAGSGAPSMLNG